jgi:uridine phosphorylase
MTTALPPEGSGVDPDGAVVHITPQAHRAYLAARRGVAPHKVRVPPLLVGTWQRLVWARLHERTAAGPDPFGPFRDDPEHFACGRHGGRDLLIGRFPIGAPATITLVEDLIACGARRLLFVGAAGSLSRDLPIGSLALATGANREEGTSFHYLPADASPRPAPALLAALRRAASDRRRTLAEGPVWTTDAVYRELTAKVQAYAAQGVLAVEMEAAALFAVARFRGVEAALIVAMSDELFHPWVAGFHAEEYRSGILEATEIALAALALLQDGGA